MNAGTIDWEALVAMRPALCRIARSVLGDEHEAEDAVQEALLSAWRSAGSVRDPQAFAGWVLTIARNSAHNLLRSRIRRSHATMLIAGWSAAGVPEPEDRRTLRPDAIPELNEAIAGLPAIMQRTLAQDLGGLGLAEISSSEHISYAAAKTRVSRARARLREALA